MAEDGFLPNGEIDWENPHVRRYALEWLEGKAWNRGFRAAFWGMFIVLLIVVVTLRVA